MAPIGYYDKKSETLYSSDFKNQKIVGYVDPVHVEFDPFAFENIIEESAEFNLQKTSNKEWKVFVDFR